MFGKISLFTQKKSPPPESPMHKYPNFALEGENEGENPTFVFINIFEFK